jgi:hypothetical protein
LRPALTVALGNQSIRFLYARFTPEAAVRALNRQTTAAFAGSPPNIRARGIEQFGG